MSSKRLVDPFAPLRAGSRIHLRAVPPPRPRRRRLARSKLLDWTIYVLGVGTGGIVGRLLAGWQG